MAIVNGYCTLAELKADLRISVVLAAPDDALLEQCVEAASRWIDRTTGRKFWLDPAPVARVFNPEAVNLVAFATDLGVAPTSVKTDTAGDGTYATTIAASSYVLGPTNALVDDRPLRWLLLVDGTSWPTAAQSGRPTVQVTGRWGWPAVPAQVKRATLILASRYWARRNSPEGIVGLGDMGGVRISTQDRDVLNLVRNFRSPVLA